MNRRRDERGWTRTRLRFAVQLNPSKSEVGALPEGTEVSFLPMEAIGEDGSLNLEATRPLGDVLSGYTYLRDGDVAIAKITPCFENGKGARMRGLLGSIGFGTTELIVTRPKPGVADSSFLQWLFSSPDFRRAGEGEMYGAGGQKRVPDDFVRNYSIALPSIREQAAIAAFLDRETGKIDALVAEQRRLIELLKEKRQAVISHAVTKGLDPTAKIKPSGVEWLGDVPAHWTVTPLMRLTDPKREIMYGIVLPGPNVEDGIPIVKGGDVRPHRLQVELLNRTTPEIEAPYARARLRPGDIVYSIRGTIGDAEIVPDDLLDANITQDVARVSPGAGLNNRWLLYALKADGIFVQLAQRSLGAAVRGINIFDLKRARVPVPPRREQDAIAAHLDEQTRRLDALAGAVRAAVQLLAERRAALISSAVTGKIDVHVAEPGRAPSDPARFRIVVGAEIVDRLAQRRVFGRVKLQKIIYLAEVHIGCDELRGNYLREAAGPLDWDMISEVEEALARAGHAVTLQPDGPGGQVHYELQGQQGAYRAELVKALGHRTEEFDRLIALMADLDTKAAEAVATLYAVWNDLLLVGQPANDVSIVSGVLDDWHPEKRQKFRSEELQTWLGWMRRHELVPSGREPRTQHGRLFA